MISAAPGAAEEASAALVLVPIASTSRATMRPCGPEPGTRDSSMPASAPSLRARGEIATPPILAGPKFFPGVRTSKNGSRTPGPVSVRTLGTATGAARPDAEKSLAGAGGAGAPARAGTLAPAPDPSEITATTVQTGAVSP